MQNIKSILKKEIMVYFNSPIAYIVIVIFLIMSGWFFTSNLFIINQPTIEGFLQNVPMFFLFIIPAITMRMFAEEFKTGTVEIIYTLPVEAHEIILGKYLSALFFTWVMILLTLIYPITISLLGEVDFGVIFGSYLGLLFLSAMFVAIGIFASSISKNQIVGFIVGFFFCFFFFMLGKVLTVMPGFFVNLLDFIGIDSHFENISKGVIDTRDIIYYLSTILLFLYATAVVLEKRR